MARRTRKNVGVIGLGIIGSRVAAGLRKAGHQVFVWSRTPQAEPNFLGSPAQVAEVCQIIQIFVSDADAVFETIERFAGHLTRDHVILCHSTIAPKAVLEAARRVEAQGASFVDAPFTGSREAAAANELVYYLGGKSELLDRVEPFLEPTSKKIVRIGEVGQAAVVKVALNMLIAVTTQTLAESLAVVRGYGVPAEKLVEALEFNGVRSGVTDGKMPKMIERDHEPHFSLKHMFKDVQIAIHLANALDLDIPATTATAGAMYGVLNKGWGDQDVSVISEVFPQPEPPAEELVEIPAMDALPPVEKEEESDVIPDPMPDPEVAPEPVPPEAAVPPVAEVTILAEVPRTGEPGPVEENPKGEASTTDVPKPEDSASEEASSKPKTRPRSSGGILGALFGSRR